MFDLLKGVSVQILLSLKEHFAFIGLIFLYVTMVFFIGYFFNILDRISFNLYYLSLLQVLTPFLVLFFIYHSIYVMVMIRPARLFSYLIQEWKGDILQPRRIINGSLILLLIPIYMSAFSSLKVNISLINPFLWDHIFANLDSLVHFGLPPWKILQPLLGYPFITNGINFFYHIWFFIMYGILFWQAFSLKNPQLRMQYLLSFVLLWMVLGSFMAIAFASVGPCYYGRIFDGSDPFQHLMQYLWSVKENYPLWALDVQETLWEDYHLGGLDKGRGISAMPSLHVATSVLFALLGWKTNKILGILLTLFAVIVLIGSVHLGWHYAIDGYVAVFCTILIWKSTGYFVQYQSKF